LPEKIKQTIAYNKQKTNEIDRKPLHNDFMEKTLQRKKLQVLKHSQCIIQQLKGYNIL